MQHFSLIRITRKEIRIVLKKQLWMHSLFPINVVFLLLFNTNLAFTQFYSTGQDPSSIRWEKIETGKFQLVYPLAFRQEALRFASVLNHAGDSIPGSLQKTPGKIPILLHTHTQASNGLVVWAPKRMELFTTPPQDQYGQDWMIQLALHEYRHVVQMDLLNQGFTKYLGKIFGEQGIGLSAGLVPRWFFEGDAVHGETAFSSTGRGRMPTFDMELRCLTLEKKTPYSFQKMIRGSYKDYVPDYYQLGYKMSAWTRFHFGQEVFTNALNNTARHPFHLFPFYQSLRKQTGLTRQEILRSTFLSLDSSWNCQMPDTFYPHVAPLNSNPKKSYTDYKFPVFVNDSIILAQKTSLDKPQGFFIISPDGTEKRVITPGSNSLVRLSGSNNQLVWAEDSPHPRWEHGGYSCLWTWNYPEGKPKQLTFRTRFYAPSFSPDGKEIVAVSISPENKFSLVFINSSTGSITNEVFSPDNLFLMQPVWINQEAIAALLITDKGKAIAIINPRSAEWKIIFGPTFSEISDLSGHSNWLFFRGGFSGLSDIYAMNLYNYSVYRITSHPFGAFFPSPSPQGNKLLFSAYTAMGFDILEIPLDSSQWEPYEKVKYKPVPMYEIVSQREGLAIRTDLPPSQHFLPENYPKYLHLFKFHSWLPFYADYDAIQAGDPEIWPGLTLLSQNILGTAFSSIAGGWRENYFFTKNQFTYEGWFPKLEFSQTYGGYPQVFKDLREPPKTVTTDLFTLSARLYVPLNLSKGKYTRILFPSVSLDYQNDWFYNYENSSYSRGISFLSYRFLAYQYTRTSYRDIVPRFGQLIDLNLRNTPFESLLFGSVASTRFVSFLPGILPNHSIQISGAWQKQFYDGDRFQLGNLLSIPRGYDNFLSSQIKKASIDYFFPLIYPDLSIEPVAYFKRIRMSIFADLAGAKDVYLLNSPSPRKGDREFFSTGAELLTDCHLFQIMFPISLGTGFYWIPGEKRSFFRPLFRMNLTPF